jgi:hypothetical protein
MKLAQVVYRIATDADFARCLVNEPRAFSVENGASLPTEDRDILLSILCGTTRWDELCSPQQDQIVGLPWTTVQLRPGI